MPKYTAQIYQEKRSEIKIRQVPFEHADCKALTERCDLQPTSVVGLPCAATLRQHEFNADLVLIVCNVNRRHGSAINLETIPVPECGSLE